MIHIQISYKFLSVYGIGLKVHTPNPVENRKIY